MIGKIYSIEENYVFVDLAIDISTQENLINVHVVFEDGANRVVGEIQKIDKTVAKIGIVGEILEDKFITGINKKPSFRSKNPNDLPPLADLTQPETQTSFLSNNSGFSYIFLMSIFFIKTSLYVSIIAYFF